MPRLLHIVTGPADDFQRRLRDQACSLTKAEPPDCVILGEEEPDYEGLVRRIFAAQRVQVWSVPTTPAGEG